ncbi:esterase/lipase family protein [Paraliomyxa miuraensis]|uniref:esterase/lipase family protein n=1 Tax=Paraliomyxa miuraensis TaxID=376150 RepID=UPI0022581F32|nr:triacylglycerol lipase [Paraliomyxa miuraensis]MCX4245338.1 triacylglycerol lipase [Paraliomyxa miuraensis]
MTHAPRPLAPLAVALLLTTLAVGCDVEDGRRPSPLVFGQGTPPTDDPDPVPVEQGMTKLEVAELTSIGAAAWGDDICALSTNDLGQNWYEDDECDWYCPRPDAACNVGPVGPDPEGSAAQYPLVLVHGFMDKGGAFIGLEPALRADGHEVERVSLPPIAPVAVRAEHLAAQVDAILEQYGVEKVNLIGHSMGGLDSRYLVHHLGYADRVASVTTIATPHRGSVVADTVLGWTDADNEWVDWLMDKVVAALENNFEGGDDEDLIGALEDLSTAGTAVFNANTPDDAEVFYQSWAGVSSPIAKWQDGVEAQCGDVLAAEPYFFGFGNDRMAAMLIPLSAVVGGINDGVVSVHSATWGRMRGCIPADHLDQVKDQGGPLWITGYDSARFLRQVAFGLSKRGY